MATIGMVTVMVMVMVMGISRNRIRLLQHLPSSHDANDRFTYTYSSRNG